MRLKASVTIFLSLVITVVIVVVCTVIESARISVSQMEGKAATYMAVESVFAGYGKQLYQDYGILLAWEQEPLGNQVTRYMQDNINMADLDFKKYDFSNIEIESVNILKQKYATDKEGDLFVKQVVDYAKYIVGIDAVNKLISDSEEENNNKETCNEIKENSNVTNIANDVSKEMIGIVEKINTQIDELKKTEKLKGKMSAVFQKFDDLKANITANITVSWTAEQAYCPASSRLPRPSAWATFTCPPIFARADNPCDSHTYIPPTPTPATAREPSIPIHAMSVML